MTTIEPPGSPLPLPPPQRSPSRVLLACLLLSSLTSAASTSPAAQPAPAAQPSPAAQLPSAAQPSPAARPSPGAQLPSATQSSSPASPWRLVWSDEFNAPAGTPPDPAKWSFDIGGNGYGNHELETYTSHPANAQQKDGHLVIAALKQDTTGPDGIPRHYTSARILTNGHFSQAYGRFEARMQLPLGKGIWPAFWLLGDNIASTPWPASGEIDVMENIGDASTIYSTLHGPGYSGGHAISARYPLPAGEAVNTAFHIYALEWAPNDIRFFLDNTLIAERTPADLPAGATWVYDHPFFLILNLAVGGDWPGSPDATTTFPQQMLVDYVRVYTKSPSASAPGVTATAPDKHDHDRPR